MLSTWATLSRVGQAVFSKERTLDFVRNQPAVTWEKGASSKGRAGIEP